MSLDTKKPLQVDVKMRVDIYQHVAEDVDNIEDMISSKNDQTHVPEKVGLFFLRTASAWAQTLEDEKGYPEHVLAAVERRRARRPELVRWEQRGVIGENRVGKVELMDPGFSDKEVIEMVRQENADRSIIYSYVAAKNGVAVDQTGRVFAERIHADAPQGTPLESADGAWNRK